MPGYPAAPRLDLVEVLHGHDVADPYRWLEDPGTPETQQWVREQAALAGALLDGLPGRAALRDQVAALTSTGSCSVPVWRGGRAFWLRREPGEEHPVLWWRDGEGVSRRLLDPAVLDPTGLTTLDDWWPSPGGDLLAYQLSVGGSEESELRVLLVVTGDAVDGPIGRTRYSSLAWEPDGGAFFYVRRLPPEDVPAGEADFHRRVWRHRIGTSIGEDQLVWGEGLDPTNYYGCSLSRDGRWLVLSASAGTAPREEVWLADLHGTATPRPVQVGVDARCQAWVRDGRLWLLTDRDAPRGRLCVADPGLPTQWRTVVAEDEEAVLCDVTHVASGLVLHRVRHGLAELAHLELRGDQPVHETPLELPGVGSVLGVTSEPDGGPDAWFGWTDPHSPPRVHRFDGRTQGISLWEDAPGRPASTGAETRHLTTVSADGTVVRALVLFPPGGPDRPRPTVLYGYGGFGISLGPEWSAAAQAWVRAGGVWVVAGLRGGSEQGEEWHRAGMRDRKQNVFDDFAAVADQLVLDGWTTPQQLGILGGSNGGLLVGAAMTQRPEAYAAVVCSAPLLDMARYELFGLGRTWSDEYGTAADPTELGWLLGYSPYHHVRPGTRYPAVLFTVFDADSRVDVLHARKMCAALQHASASDAPIVFRLESDVGHGARSVSRSVELLTDELAFLAAATGLQL